jgi:hypothetical protein
LDEEGSTPPRPSDSFPLTLGPDIEEGLAILVSLQLCELATTRKVALVFFFYMDLATA